MTTVVLALNPLSATDLLSSFGTLGVAVILFAETGLLIGSSSLVTRCCSLQGCWRPPVPVGCT